MPPFSGGVSQHNHQSASDGGILNNPAISGAISGNFTLPSAVSDNIVTAQRGGSLVLLDTKIANNSASLDFTTDINATYETYLFDITRVIPASAGQSLWARVSVNGGSSYLATNVYAGELYSHNSNATDASVESGAGSMTEMVIGTSIFSSSRGYSGQFKMFQPYRTDAVKFFSGTNVNYGGDTLQVRTGICGWMFTTAASAVNAIRFLFSFGNIDSGEVRLYGYKK